MANHLRPSANEGGAIIQHRMTNWYAPGQLLDTGVQVLVSEVIGTRSDFRITESFGPQQQIYDFSEHAEIWFDYVADLGDGWNSTYTIASLLARAALTLKDPKTQTGVETKRGQILIMGGDEVYPLASRDNYQEKLVGPYESAHPHSEPPHPVVFAIPGNHDWYDGLISFTRLFCQERWIGGWKTMQRRSYFAVKLPHRWWLWGVDLQLESDIDQPQLDYFRSVADKMKPGDKVVLLTAEPDWIYGNIYDPKLQKNLAFLEESIIQKRACGRMAVALAGDLHHYRRHEARDGSGTQLITSGGGGAFLHPAIGESVETIRIGRDGQREFGLKSSFPTKETSRRLLLGDFLFPFYNPQFGALAGVLYFVVAWTLGFWTSQGSLWSFIVGLLESPTAVFWILAILSVFIAFTDTHKRLYKYIAGGLHGLANFAGIVASSWAAEQIVGPPAARPIPLHDFLAMAGIIFVLGYALSSFIMGAYLYLSLQFFRRHANEAFSALHIADYKNFLRLHIDQNGSLTIYPVGIEKVPRKWMAATNPSPAEPRLVPADRKIEPFMIEPPIVISG
jgi:hypothetical protein